MVERTSVHKLLERIKDVLPGGDKWDDEAGILDTNYHLAMLRFREEHQLAGVARRLKRGIDAGMEPGLVFSRVQDHVIAAARSHVERLVLEAFVDKLATVPESDNRRALALLCDLHALSVIEADRAWFMEHGRLTVAALEGDLARGGASVPPGPADRGLAGGRVRRTSRDAARTGAGGGHVVSEPFGGIPSRWTPDGASTGLLLVLPGVGYGPASPLLEYARQAGLAAGLTVQQVFWDVPEDLAEPAGWVRGQAETALAAEPPDVPVVVVGKSLGTFGAGFAAARSLPAIWLTPLLGRPEVVEGIRANPSRQLVVGGTGDDRWDPEVAASLAVSDRVDVLQIDGADHAMLVDDPVRSAEILVEVTRAMVRFLAV